MTRTHLTALVAASLLAFNASAEDARALDQEPVHTAAHTAASLGSLPAQPQPVPAALPAAQAEAPPVSGATVAYGTTALDGVTTAVGLAGSAVELNPLFASLTPAGAIAVTAVKLGAVHHADKNMTGKQRESVLKNSSAFFGGAGINNLLVIAGAASGVSVVAGLVSGLFFYNDTEKRLKAERIAKRRELREQRERERALAELREAENGPVLLGMPMVASAL